MLCCAFSIGRKFPSTPTLPKTTSAPASPKEKFPAEPSAKKAAMPVTSCSAWQKHAGNLTCPSTNSWALASAYPASQSRPSPNLSAQLHPNLNQLPRKFAPVTRAVGSTRDLDICHLLDSVGATQFGQAACARRRHADA